MSCLKGLSWKTTTAGCIFISGLATTLMADPMLAPIIAPYKGYFLLATTIAGYAAHALAKDGDVTGGSRVNVQDPPPGGDRAKE